MFRVLAVKAVDTAVQISENDQNSCFQIFYRYDDHFYPKFFSVGPIRQRLFVLPG